MKIRPLIAAFIILCMIHPSYCDAKNLGPVESYADLVRCADLADEGDTVIVSGKVQADETTPLTSRTSLHITSSPENQAVVSGLHLMDAQVSFSNIDLVDSLKIEGTSNVMLASNVNVSGDKEAAIDFKGNGELIVDPSCTVTGVEGADGISIHHSGGNLYAALEGTISGGNSSVGGVGVVVSPLQSEGLLLIGGNISGGSGTDIGGNAVNLYDIVGNAFISVTGNIKGGDGPIGGDGVQIISPRDTSNIGIIGYIEGGNGNDYGGNAVIVMNASDRSSISLSGALVGGNTNKEISEPGQSLLLVGNGAINHMVSNGCMLEDGQVICIISERTMADAPMDVVPDDVPPELSIFEVSASTPVASSEMPPSEMPPSEITPPVQDVPVPDVDIEPGVVVTAETGPDIIPVMPVEEPSADATEPAPSQDEPQPDAFPEPVEPSQNQDESVEEPEKTERL